ncbi:MAG: hypothetical protein V1718_01780 [archaeon]
MDASSLEQIAYGFAAGGGIAALVLNVASYLTTIDVARRQEKWTQEEFQEKCDTYWREPIIRDDIESNRKIYEIIADIASRPGKYLACKQLSLQGYKAPENY